MENPGRTTSSFAKNTSASRPEEVPIAWRAFVSQWHRPVFRSPVSRSSKQPVNHNLMSVLCVVRDLGADSILSRIGLMTPISAALSTLSSKKNNSRKGEEEVP